MTFLHKTRTNRWGERSNLHVACGIPAVRVMNCPHLQLGAYWPALLLAYQLGVRRGAIGRGACVIVAVTRNSRGHPGRGSYALLFKLRGRFAPARLS